MPDIWMDVDVALSEVPINKAQLIDDGDFKTREESVVYNQSGLDLVWNFITTAGVFTQTAVTPTDTGGNYDFVNQGNGFYTIEMPASGGASINNDTEGVGWFAGFATGILPWVGPTIGFRAAALNNSLIDAGTTGLLGPATAGRTLVVDANGLADANTVKVGPTGAGTAQTAGDIPARLPAALTANGNMKSSLLEIIATVLAEGAAGRIAAAWQGMWNVTSPVATAQSVNQTGDSFARIGATGSGLTSLAPSATALSSANYTSARAGYLDNLNIGGAVASQAEVLAVQNNTRVVRVVPVSIERPDSGTTTYRIELLLYDAAGNMEAPDSAPTVALVDQGGTDLSARLDSATGSLVSTGRYRWVYTASTTDDLEQLVWTFSVVEGGATRLYGNTTVIVDTTAVDFTSADRTKLEAIHTKLPSKDFLTGTTNSDGDVQIDESTGDFNATQQTRIQTQAAAAITAASLATAAALTTVGTNVSTLLTNLATLAAKFTGITLLAQWLGAMAGKHTANSTALTEINATGAGGGTFATGDGLEGIKDGLPAGGGDATAANQATIIAHLEGIKGASWAAGDNLKAIEDGIAALSAGTGAGAFSVPLTIYQAGGVTLVPECDIVLTTTSTSPATNIYASGRTNANGVVTFQCDAGTYYIWRQKAGINFSNNPLTLTVDGSGTGTVS